MSQQTPPVTLRDRVKQSLQVMGAIQPADRASTEYEPPVVVVERLESVQRWAEAMVRAEVARELELMADQLDVGEVPLTDAPDVLRERADDLRHGK